MSVDVCARLGYTADWRERYWDDDAQTQAVMKQDENGTLWMYTGDEGIMDEDGYLRSMFFFSPFHYPRYSPSPSRRPDKGHHHSGRRGTSQWPHIMTSRVLTLLPSCSA